jgi:hypothetical protein
LIADGMIKLKNDSQIKEFTEAGLLFEDNIELLADIVIFATGFVLSSPSSPCPYIHELSSDSATLNNIFAKYAVLRWLTNVRQSGALIKKEKQMVAGVIWACRVCGI